MARQLGQFGGKLHVRDIARRKRSDDHTRQQIPSDQRQLQALRQKAEQEREAEAGNEGGDQGRFVGQCFMDLSGALGKAGRDQMRFWELCQETMG